MDRLTITDEVNSAVAQWIKRYQRTHEREISFSDGALDVLVQMIVNIAEDPSRQWHDIDPSESQRESVRLIQNVLNEIFLRRRPPHIRPRRNTLIPRKGMITSWEIWHGISFALDDFCFIPKDV